MRRVITRFAPENVEANQPLLLMLQRFAEQKHAPRADFPCVDVMQKAVDCSYPRYAERRTDGGKRRSCRSKTILRRSTGFRYCFEGYENISGIWRDRFQTINMK